MRMLCTALLACACLLPGCESRRPAPFAQAPVTAQTPAQVVASLNRLYNDVQQNDCREIGTNLPRGHYYCSGIIIRATEDGDYLPWTFSPGAVAQGAASFSWIRRDMHPAVMFRPSGFVVRTVKEAEQTGLPGYDAGMICLYPLDASTSGNRGHNGCAVRQPSVHVFYPQPDVPHRNAAYAWGSCEDIGVTTLGDWLGYTGDMQGGATEDQCSWNADSQSGWNNAIATPVHYPDLSFIWNELLMATVDDGYSLKNYIPAVYLAASSLETGLEPARNFQRKLAAHGNQVPIVRLDLQAAQPFSYHEEDQVIAQQ